MEMIEFVPSWTLDNLLALLTKFLHFDVVVKKDVRGINDMRYLKRLFNKFEILLLATATVSLFVYAFSQWFSNFPKVCAFVFGIALTPIHVFVWAILVFVGVPLFIRLQKIGQRYARTPRGEGLLFPDKIIWFLGFLLLDLVIYSFFKRWSWIEILEKNYNLFAIPVAYLFLAIMLPFIIGCITIKRKRTTVAKSNEPIGSVLRICCDDPIETSNEDELGRDNFVDKMCSLIDNYQATGSRVIGINGAWGEGKSSVINLLREKISKEKHEWVPVDFNPWFFMDEPALIRGFFRSIDLQLRKRYLISGLSKYTEAITEVLQSATTNIGPIGINLRLNSKVSAEEILGLKEKLEIILKRIDRKVVILIDDVDRLAPSELLLLLKLVRLCANFYKFIYVLSFDRKTICDLLKSADIKEPNAYLEKIVQTERQLPQVEKRKIDGFLGEGLDEVFKAFGITLEEKELERFRSLYSDHITHKIQNLRHAKRLISALIGILGEIKGEVNIIDVIGLEALRIFAYPLWCDISDSPQFYVFPWGENYFVMRRRLPIDDNQRIRNMREHLEAVLKDVEVDSLEFAKDVMTSLFPVAGDALEGRGASYGHLEVEYIKQQRVAVPDYLKKYMQQHVPFGVISDKHFREILNQANESSDIDRSKNTIIEAFVNYQQDGLLRDFIQKFILHRSDLNETGEVLILKAIFEYSDRFSEETTIILDSELDRALVLIYAIANKYKNSQKIHDVLKEAISSSKRMYFASAAIIQCAPSRTRVIESFDNIDLADLKKIYKERFKREYVEPKKDIFTSEAGAVRYLMYPIEDSVLLTEYMLSLFRQRPSYAGKLLLLYAADRHLGSDRSRWRFQYEDLKTKFGIEKLYEYVKEHRDEAYENDDEKWAVEQFLKIHEEQARMPRV